MGKVRNMKKDPLGVNSLKKCNDFSVLFSTAENFLNYIFVY